VASFTTYAGVPARRRLRTDGRRRRPRQGRFAPDL